ncbi:MAG TPA: hypothetical protein VNY05_36310 [Candidatus Acidoferrales bacterium]|nr:hypothetical protein [Candidatus Acidoferrales bacterium]
MSLGVAAHITAASAGGPRYAPELIEEQRKSLVNAIWLCQTCARLIDTDPNRFSVGILRCWKADSESLTSEEIGECDVTAQRSATDVHPLRFSAIGVADQCLWLRHRSFRVIPCAKGLIQEFGFHEIPERRWPQVGKTSETHVINPIVDVTLINDSSSLGTVTAVGVELINTWTALKGIPVAQKVLPSDVYVLELKPMIPFEPQFTMLKDPVAISPGGLFRYQLWLGDFGAAVQNESLIRLVVEFEGNLQRSGIVYLGRY